MHKLCGFVKQLYTHWITYNPQPGISILYMADSANPVNTNKYTQSWMDKAILKVYLAFDSHLPIYLLKMAEQHAIVFLALS